MEFLGGDGEYWQVGCAYLGTVPAATAVVRDYKVGVCR